MGGGGACDRRQPVKLIFEDSWALLLNNNTGSTSVLVGAPTSTLCIQLNTRTSE